MCDKATSEQVVNLVNGFVRRNAVFSAWDVTCEGRKELGLKAPHQELKGVVHGVWASKSMPGYARSLVPFNGVDAWVYHPKNVDPKTGIATSQPTGIYSTATPASSAPASDSVTKTLTPDSETLYVPNKFVNQLGLDIGDPACVIYSNGKATISADSGFGDVIHVDLRGNLRLSTNKLTAACGIVGKSVIISYASNKVEVTEE